MGTPDIARQCLLSLLQTEHEVLCVYTRADKPVGRKQVLTSPPVKQLAEERGVAVFQPPNMRGEETFTHLSQLAPDLIVVVAYGCILPSEILVLPKYGCINLHVSLLPQYRGAAPIQWAVIDGHDETGVSIMRLDEGLDTGDVLSCERFPIEPEATAGEVLGIAAKVGTELLVRTLADIEKGTAVATEQTGAVSLAPTLNKKMAAFNFDRSALELHNLVRGCNPWPLAWFEAAGKRIKVLKARVSTLEGKAGEVLALNPLVVGCETGALELLQVLPEGKKEMSGTQWAQGKRLQVHDRME